MENDNSSKQYNPSGLDMKEALDWYNCTVVEMPPITEKNFLYPVKNKELIELSKGEMGGLFALFPKNARERSILRRVIGQPPTWFHRDSTSEQPKITTNESDAMSPTAIVPSYIDYTPWRELKVPTADIWLFKIPQNAASKEVRRIVLAEGFVHEIGHSIIQPALYTDNHILQFPDGKIMDGLEAMLHFAELAEKHPPISHYASTYRGPNNKFERDNQKYNVNTAISEEMCETIAAYLLGFAYCKDDSRRKNPFLDRAEVRDFVRDFLNAELIKKE
ncbi:MAG: hypothetical protein QW727_02915 [Candidatus Pacearchaeota archaeon]